MRTITTLLLAMLALSTVAFIPQTSRANGYANGYCEGGYTYRDGYWYDSQGYAYTRYRDKCYYGRGCWYWCWRYVRYSTPAATKPVDWRAALVQMADAHKEQQDKLAAAQEENKTFIEAVKALGVSCTNGLPNGLPFGLQGLPSGNVLPGGKPFVNFRQYVQQGFNAEQGNTLFSVAQLSDIYSQNDLSVLFQQASQLASGAQQLSSDATAQFDTLIEKEAAGRQRVAEIIAKTALVRETLRNTNPPTREIRDVEMGYTESGEEIAITDLKSLITNRCIRCHNAPTEKNKGVDLSKYDTFTPEQKDFVFDTVAKGKMPPGKKLTSKELRLFAQ